MHIKFPMIIVMLCAMLLGAQVKDFWEDYMLQISDHGQFYVLILVITALIISLMLIRTPKQLRRGDGLFFMCACSLVMSYVMAYGVSLAISGPVQHYPAVVVERKEEVDDDNSYKVLTVMLDDGTTAKLQVSDYMYQLEGSGTEFVVCQKKNFLGIRMLRLHLPKDSEILNSQNNESKSE